MFTLIENCRIVSPDVEIAEGSILIENNRIIRVAPGKISVPAGSKIIDAAGLTAVWRKDNRNPMVPALINSLTK